MEQLATKEFIEFKLQELAQTKERVMVRFFLFGSVELCLFGEIKMDFEDPTAEPFFFVNHPNQYATSIRFYGSDIQRVMRGPNGVVEIFLGLPQKQEA